MKITLTKSRFFQLLAELNKANPDGQWTSLLEKSGQGDYGYNETFSLNGTPKLMLSVGYYPPVCTAFAL